METSLGGFGKDAARLILLQGSGLVIGLKTPLGLDSFSHVAVWGPAAAKACSTRAANPIELKWSAQSSFVSDKVVVHLCRYIVTFHDVTACAYHGIWPLFVVLFGRGKVAVEAFRTMVVLRLSGASEHYCQKSSPR